MLHPAAVLAEADRLGASPLWAGFDPRTVPVLFFDGERSWLCRHPAPPAEFISDPESGAAGLEGAILRSSPLQRCSSAGWAWRWCRSV